MGSKPQFETSERSHAPVGRESPFDDPTEILLSMQDVVGRKWHPVILHTLFSSGPMGFSALKNHVSGISSKMLSESLDSLETDGLVTRERLSDQPLRVEYSLTGRGESLARIVSELVRWGSDHTAVLEGGVDSGEDAQESRSVPSEHDHTRLTSREGNR